VNCDKIAPQHSRSRAACVEVFIMPNLDRRTLLYAFGVASVTSILPSHAAAATKVALCNPGESRFVFGSAAQAQTSPCKVSSEDTNGDTRSSSLTPCRAQDRSSTLIIAKTNGITCYQENSSSEQVARNILW
jgi:hypothetical protein